MWGIVGYVLKFKPMIFCCKAQAHALEFSLAGVGIFGSKQKVWLPSRLVASSYLPF